MQTTQMDYSFLYLAVVVYGLILGLVSIWAGRRFRQTWLHITGYLLVLCSVGYITAEFMGLNSWDHV